MEGKRPSYREIESAFASSRLEPEVTDAAMEAYAAGTATEAEREIVETMMEVDPAVFEAVSALREELSRVSEPLPVLKVRRSPMLRRTPRPRWLYFAFSFASAACVVLIAHDLATTAALGVWRRDSAALRSDVSALQAQLHLKSLVAQALAHGLKIPAPVADVGATRGEIQLDLQMTPQDTLVRQPVTLTWSGRGAGQGTAGRVEVSSSGQPVWQGHGSNGTIGIPSSALTPGKSYSWRVVLGTKVSGWSSFQICTVAQAQKAAEIEFGPTLDALDRGILYAQMGFVADARREFESLKKSDPALAGRLIRELEAAPH